jgi:hypothetical protein
VIAVKGEPSAVWQMAFSPGALTVNPGGSDGDTRFEGDAAALARLVYGRATWQELEADGRLTVSGSRAAADRFHSLFKGP